MLHLSHTLLPQHIYCSCLIRLAFHLLSFFLLLVIHTHKAFLYLIHSSYGSRLKPCKGGCNDKKIGSINIKSKVHGILQVWLFSISHVSYIFDENSFTFYTMCAITAGLFLLKRTDFLKMLFAVSHLFGCNRSCDMQTL